MIDSFMHAGSAFVRGLIFDAAASHVCIRRILFGVMTPQDEELVNDPTLTFLPKLSYDDLPQHALPRFPVRIAKFEQEPYYALPGCCAWL